MAVGDTRIRTVVAYSVHGRSGDRVIDYRDFFDTILDRAPDKPTRREIAGQMVALTAARRLEGGEIALRFISGNEFDIPIFYDVRTGVEELVERRDGVFVVGTWAIVNPETRMVALENKRTGVGAGLIERYLELDGRDFGYQSLRIDLNQASTEGFDEEARRLETIKQVAVTVRQPNLDWADDHNAIHDYAATLDRAPDAILSPALIQIDPRTLGVAFISATSYLQVNGILQICNTPSRRWKTTTTSTSAHKEQRARLMNATLLARSGAPTEQVLFDEKVQQEAREVIAEAHDRKPVGIAVELEDGSTISLPAELSQALVFALKGMTQGDVTMRALPEELTTSTAAGILGISRPTLMKLIASKELPAKMVGSHHRLNVRDVLALRDKRDQARAAAFEELRQIDADLDLDLE